MIVAREERAREHATMLAIGIRTRTIITTAIAESTLIGIAGTILGMLGGWFALGWVLNVAGQTLPDLGLERTIHPGTLALTTLIGVVARPSPNTPHTPHRPHQHPRDHPHRRIAEPPDPYASTPGATVRVRQLAAWPEPGGTDGRAP